MWEDGEHECLFQQIFIPFYLAQNGSPLPEFETGEAHDYFITRLFVREGFYDYQKVEGSGTTKETTKETTRQLLVRTIEEQPAITMREGSTKAGSWKIVERVPQSSRVVDDGCGAVPEEKILPPEAP